MIISMVLKELGLHIVNFLRFKWTGELSCANFSSKAYTKQATEEAEDTTQSLMKQWSAILGQQPTSGLMSHG